MNSSNMEAHRVHLKQRLHNVWHGNKSVNDCVMEIKYLAEDLACVNVDVLDNGLVSTTLNGLGSNYKSLDRSISMHGHIP